ncbi:hypothetical protein [Paenibacillus sp. MMS18-CY102]|uniref:hypothetical protein n=1 Tax=Paenibacillus sp. MMS18-CY102 TaxID=2682849 RepID=UPI001365D7F1|nr:hypothetical protein [Paenibacillus sp. MMS18-CY102]MWC28133.1 hypothetical protein [Paenibacillus sp. MMS18-CY102]
MDQEVQDQSGQHDVYENFPVAEISSEDVQRIQQLEQDLGVVLVAYEGGVV